MKQIGNSQQAGSAYVPTLSEKPKKSTLLIVLIALTAIYAAVALFYLITSKVSPKLLGAERVGALGSGLTFGANLILGSSLGILLFSESSYKKKIQPLVEQNNQSTISAEPKQKLKSLLVQSSSEPQEMQDVWVSLSSFRKRFSMSSLKMHVSKLIERKKKELQREFSSISDTKLDEIIQKGFFSYPGKEAIFFSKEQIRMLRANHLEKFSLDQINALFSELPAVTEKSFERFEALQLESLFFLMSKYEAAQLRCIDNINHHQISHIPIELLTDRYLERIFISIKSKKVLKNLFAALDPSLVAELFSRPTNNYYMRLISDRQLRFLSEDFLKSISASKLNQLFDVREEEGKARFDVLSQKQQIALLENPSALILRKAIQGSTNPR